jgi:UDPglucose 6-dehydrogenase
MPRIAIIGYGVVGRALGGVLAAKVRGAEVAAYDSMAIGRPAGKVRVTKALPNALKGADFIFLCVPSHLKGEGVSGSGWKTLAGQIAQNAEPAAIIIIKSTLVPGDAAKLEAMTRRRIVVCPEFMSEGTAERDILRPYRVLVGGKDLQAVEAVIGLYRWWVPASRIIRMDAWSAQLSKLLGNAMLAQRVSSINSVTGLCELGGGDVRAVAESVGRDPRIGALYLDASPGFGGSCLEKDVRLLCALARCMGRPEVARYWKSVIDQNDAHIRRVTRRISQGAGRGGKITVIGLGFKGGVSDVRNSSSMRIIEGLLAARHPIVAYDPLVKKLRGIDVKSRIQEAVVGAKVVAILTNDISFRKIDWDGLCPAGAKLYDGHGVLSDLRGKQLDVISLGRSSR